MIDKFIDSNIFLYAFSDKDLIKQKIAKDIVLSLATISVQVINEVSNNLLKKFQIPNNELKFFIEDFYDRYKIISLNKEIFIKAVELREKYNFSYYDSLIVASAVLSDCEILYSEDMHHKLVIEDLVIINPFKG